MRVHNEYSSMVNSMRLVERFGDEKEAQKFQLEENLFDSNNNQNEVFREEISDSEVPADSIGKMNERGEQMMSSNNGNNKVAGGSPARE